jgi:hypothetical protein
VFLGAALFVARPAAAGSPNSADRLVAGESTKRGPIYVVGARGATYELKGGAVVEFDAGSEFSFEPSLKLKLRKPNDPDTLTRALRIVRGKVEVAIPEGRPEPTAVMFRGPSKMSAVAKEGKAAFDVASDRTSVAARVGEMLVGVGTDWKPLHEGLARTLAPEDPTALPRPILAPPAVDTDKKLAVIPGEGTAGFTAKWNVVKDAEHYEAALFRQIPSAGQAPAKTEVVSRQSVNGNTVAFPNLAAGTYSVVVASVDRQGLRGNVSAPTLVRILGIEVPSGARSDDGVIVLGRNQRVGLKGGTGLEMSFGASQEFLTAPSTVGLSHNESTLVRLRVPGSKEEATLRLEPDRMRAKVSIGPKAAQWPSDKITVEVELVDAGGREIPADAQVDAKVTVNLAPVDVKWTRSGRTLKAELPTGSGSGPWVVRAEVKDHRGTTIGRDFLEVAPGGKSGEAAPATPRFSTAMR